MQLLNGGNSFPYLYGRINNFVTRIEIYRNRINLINPIVNEMEGKGGGRFVTFKFRFELYRFTGDFRFYSKNKRRNHSQIIKLRHYSILKFIEYRFKRTYI